MFDLGLPRAANSERSQQSFPADQTHFVAKLSPEEGCGHQMRERQELLLAH